MGATTKHVDIVTPSQGDASDATPFSKTPPSSGAAFGAIAQLPIEIQVAFQQKLLAILALQLFLVAAIVGVFEWEGSIEKTIQDNVIDSVGTIALVVASLVVLLAVLYGVRNIFPLNWAVLLVFSCAQVLGLLCVDVALDSNVAFSNCGFTWITVLLMIALTKWTKPASATIEGTHDVLRSPYLLGLIAFLGACAVSAVAHFIDESIFQDKNEIAVSLAIQVCVGIWFCRELEGLHKKLSPDEYMRGVIYFYTDLLVVVLVGLLCAACASEGAVFAPDAVIVGAATHDIRGDDEV